MTARQRVEQRIFRQSGWQLWWIHCRAKCTDHMQLGYSRWLPKKAIFTPLNENVWGALKCFISWPIHAIVVICSDNLRHQHLQFMWNLGCKGQWLIFTPNIKFIYFMLTVLHILRIVVACLVQQELNFYHKEPKIRWEKCAILIGSKLMLHLILHFHKNHLLFVI